MTLAQSSVSSLTLFSASVFQPPPKPPFLSRKTLELKPFQTSFQGKMGKETSLPVTLSELKLFQAVEAASRRKNLPWVRFKCETSLLAWHFKLLLLYECFASGHRAVGRAGDCCLALLGTRVPVLAGTVMFLLAKSQQTECSVLSWRSGLCVDTSPSSCFVT